MAGRPAGRRGCTSPGRYSSCTTTSPLSQCLPRRGTSTGPAVGGAGEPRRVVGAVQGRAGVVAHPAVDARRTCGRRAAAVVAVDRDRDGLDRADAVERRRRPGRRCTRPGSTATSGTRDAALGARPATIVGQRVGDVLGGEGGVGLGVVDAPAAAEVELGHRTGGHQRRVHVHQSACGLAEAGVVEDLRADVRVQPDEARARARRGRAAAAGRPRTAGCRTSGLRARSPGTRGSRRARRC